MESPSLPSLLLSAPLFVLRGKRSFPFRSRMVNAQRCGSEGLGPSSPQALAGKRDGGERHGAGGLRSAPGAPPGAVRNAVAMEYRPTETGLFGCDRLRLTMLLFLKYCNNSSRSKGELPEVLKWI